MLKEFQFNPYSQTQVFSVIIEVQTVIKDVVTRLEKENFLIIQLPEIYFNCNVSK